jgi:hypothetical protein
MSRHLEQVAPRRQQSHGVVNESRATLRFAMEAMTTL